MKIEPTYRTKYGYEFSQKDLDKMEEQGFSEQDIAEILNISRRMLYKIRKKMNWPHKIRSDKGKTHAKS